MRIAPLLIVLVLVPVRARAQSSGGVPLVPLTGQRVACTGGFANATMNGQPVAFPCKDIDLMSFLPISAIGGRCNDNAASCTATARIATTWGWTDPQTAREYALVARTDGTAFVDVTSPLGPVYVGFMPRPAGVAPSNWRELKVLGNTLVVVSEGAGHGMQTFDLTQLRQFSGSPITFTHTARYTGFGAAHNVLVSAVSNLAIATGMALSGQSAPQCGRGLHFVNIANPADPKFNNCFNGSNTTPSEYRVGGPGYTHDAQCVRYTGPDTRYTGKEICLMSNEGVLIIADITNKHFPQELGKTTHVNARYVHQGWLTEDQRYFYVDDELDETGGVTGGRSRTIVYDVQDLTRPTPVLEYQGRTGAIDHNQYIRERYAFQANYMAGVNVLDVQNPTAPVEAAYFDTYPASNAAEFGGIWNVYPYFTSDVLVAGGMNEGLFVLKPTAIALGNEPQGPVQGFSLQLEGANPARTPVRVQFGLETATSVRVAVYDVLGHEVAVLHDGQAAIGVNTYTFDATGLASGVYIVNARTASATLSRRLVVVR